MEFYTLRDVSEMLHVSMTTIYRYVKEGRLTPAKIGNSYRVTEADLQEFVDRGKAATRARRACRRRFWMICTPQSRHTK